MDTKHLPSFEFGSVPDPNAKKDAKKVPTLVSVNDGIFTMSPRTLNSIIGTVQTRIDTLAEDNEDLTIETVEYQKLINWVSKEKNGGNDLLAYIGMKSGYQAEEEPLRFFLSAAIEYMASEETVFGSGYVLSNVNYDTITTMTLEDYQKILAAKVAEVSEEDLKTIKDKAKKIATDPKRGLRDGKLILKSKKTKKEATATA